MKNFFRKAAALLVAASSLSVAANAAELDTGFDAELNEPAPILAEGKSLSGNATLDGVLLSGYTYPLASQLFNQRAQNFLSEFELTVIMNGEGYSLSAGDLPFEINTLELLSGLWFGGEGDAADGSYTSSYSYDHSIVEEFANGIVKDLNDTIPPLKKSEPTFDPSTKKFSDGVAGGQITGYDLNPETFLNQIHAKIEDAIWKNADHKATLNIKTSPIYSKAATASDYGRLATYSTHTTNVANRNTNISLACKYINGTLLKPGETFSYNSSLGRTTSARGFKEAGILVNGKPSTGMGGGICQVSSTLYNAVLSAGLKVVERHPHSAPVSYVPAGRDATVSYGSADFRFQNNTANDLYVILDYSDRTVTASLYGKK